MNTQPYFFIRIDRKYVRLNFRDVVYMESVANYIKIHTETAFYLTPLTMKQIIKLLPDHMFCRINRGTIVPIHRIISFDNHAVTIKGMQIIFGKGYKQHLEAKINIIEQEVNTCRLPMSVGPDGLETETD